MFVNVKMGKNKVFSDAEVELLLREVLKYKEIVESKETNKVWKK